MLTFRVSHELFERESITVNEHLHFPIGSGTSVCVHRNRTKGGEHWVVWPAGGVSAEGGCRCWWGGGGEIFILAVSVSGLEWSACATFSLIGFNFRFAFGRNYWQIEGNGDAIYFASRDYLIFGGAGWRPLRRLSVAGRLQAGVESNPIVLLGGLMRQMTRQAHSLHGIEDGAPPHSTAQLITARALIPRI